jgi:hypothetical protein
MAMNRHVVPRGGRWAVKTEGKPTVPAWYSKVSPRASSTGYRAYKRGMMVMRCGDLFVPFGPRIIATEPCHEAHVFVDAGGQANKLRHWGAAYVHTKADLRAVDEIVAELKRRNAHALTPAGEIKGGKLLDSEVHWVRKQLRGYYIILWYNTYPEYDSKLMMDFRRQFEKVVAVADEGTSGSYSAYWASLKPVNQQKLFSFVVHLQRLGTLFPDEKIASQLAQLHLVADREDLPQSVEAARLVRMSLAATAREAGMKSVNIEEVFKTSPSVGAVTVDLDGDSARLPGLQLVDVMIQGANRRLDGYWKGFLDDYK